MPGYIFPALAIQLLHARLDISSTSRPDTVCRIRNIQHQQKKLFPKTVFSRSSIRLVEVKKLCNLSVWLLWPTQAVQLRLNTVQSNSSICRAEWPSSPRKYINNGFKEEAHTVDICTHRFIRRIPSRSQRTIEIFWVKNDHSFQLVWKQCRVHLFHYDDFIDSPTCCKYFSRRCRFCRTAWTVWWPRQKVEYRSFCYISIYNSNDIAELTLLLCVACIRKLNTSGFQSWVPWSCVSGYSAVLLHFLQCPVLAD